MAPVGPSTANAGIRWDKNHALDQNGTLVANDSAFSPRLGIVWDVTGKQEWSVTASFANYVSALAQSIADAASPAGNPQTLQYLYRGADINPAGAASLTATPQAIRQVFDWFFANGGTNLPLNGAPDLPGLTPQIVSSLKAPYNREFAAGVNRQFGNRASLRADFVFRDFGNFYVDHTDTTTGKTTDQFGRSYDLTLVENSGDLMRRYKGLSVQGTYQLGSRADVGGTYTLSRTWGNVDGENTGSGPISAGDISTGNVSGVVSYPEFKQSVVELPGRRPLKRPEAPLPPLGELPTALVERADRQRASDADDGYAVRHRQLHELGHAKRHRSATLCDESRLHNAAVRERDGVLLRRT